MVVLTVLVFFLMLLSSSFDYFKSNSWLIFLIMLVLFLFSLALVFLCSNFLFFYLSFEMAVVPIFIIIIGWGYSVNRAQAGLFLFLYTFFFSLPFLFFLIFIFLKGYSLSFSVILYFSYLSFSGGAFWLFFLLVFLVKLPVFFFHLWLPKAHVEAPLLGSMVLAGVLLKLGGYGLYKTAIFFYLDYSNMGALLGSFSLWGGCLVAIMCMRQLDLKSLIAYSSVVHMAPVIMVFLYSSFCGFMGGWMMMFSHGLCSACLFFLLNLSYLSLSSRSYLLNRGGLLSVPFMSFIWLAFCISNMGFPPTFNFFSELWVVVGVFLFGYAMGFFLLFMMLLSGFYSVILYLFFNHGEKKFFFNLSIMSMKDLLAMGVSLSCLFLYVFYSFLLVYLFYLVCGTKVL